MTIQAPPGFFQPTNGLFHPRDVLNCWDQKIGPGLNSVPPHGPNPLASECSFQLTGPPFDGFISSAFIPIAVLVHNKALPAEKEGLEFVIPNVFRSVSCVPARGRGFQASIRVEEH
ncbi:MAG: hypothetical protein CL694_09955 [Chloroflexi bacterium]|nr:hypothetical protein [Chloroflexota bacterium]|tara:strand:- start:495 stop:842 length:348 start_codon:yes stop_codon:yes gene_type:complete